MCSYGGQRDCRRLVGTDAEPHVTAIAVQRADLVATMPSVTVPPSSVRAVSKAAVYQSSIAVQSTPPSAWSTRARPSAELLARGEQGRARHRPTAAPRRPAPSMALASSPPGACSSHSRGAAPSVSRPGLRPARARRGRVAGVLRGCPGVLGEEDLGRRLGQLAVGGVDGGPATLDVQAAHVAEPRQVGEHQLVAQVRGHVLQLALSGERIG